MTLDWIRKELKRKNIQQILILSPVAVLHDDTFALLCPWIAFLVRGVNQWICLFMFLDVLPHPAQTKRRN